jgi:hypothetical protein
MKQELRDVAVDKRLEAINGLNCLGWAKALSDCGNGLRLFDLSL